VKLGDVVKHMGSYWLVTRYDQKRTRTADLLASGGMFTTVPFDHPVEVIANPSQDWPYVAAKVSPRLGPIENLSRPPGTLHLVLYRDWMPSEPSRAGGSIFLNPKLGLRHGDYLLAHHKGGKTSGIAIPSTFSTVAQAKKRVETKPKPTVRTAYDMILDDHQIGDDDD
jgi:hypothetical protein